MNNYPVVSCIQIAPNNKVYQFKIKFDLTIVSDIGQQTDLLMAIRSKMNLYHGCEYYKPNIAKAIYPDNSFYYAFYQDKTSDGGKPHNKLATHLVNSSYNSDFGLEKFANDQLLENPTRNSTYNKYQCYGNCYIICLDSNFNLYDVGINMFINNYNKIHTALGPKDRCYINRLYKNPKKNKCYLYEGYVKYSNKQRTIAQSCKNMVMNMFHN